MPKIYVPSNFEFTQLFKGLEYKDYYLKKNVTKKEIVRECPGFSLLFPIHYGPKNNWDKKLFL